MVPTAHLYHFKNRTKYWTIPKMTILLDACESGWEPPWQIAKATLSIFYGQRVLRHVEAAFHLLFLFFPPTCQEKQVFFHKIAI